MFEYHYTSAPEPLKAGSAAPMVRKHTISNNVKFQLQPCTLQDVKLSKNRISSNKRLFEVPVDYGIISKWNFEILGTVFGMKEITFKVCLSMINNRRKQPKRKFHLKCRLRGKNFKNHILITRGFWGEVCLLLEMIGS